MKNFLVKLLTNAFVVNIAIAIVFVFGVMYATLKWLDVYTKHNQAVVVPDVKGLTVDKAAPFMESSGLRYEIIDSVFSKKVVPGSIVELMPEAGSKVKEGRIVYITVNALTSQMAIVPRVKDLSYRQAYAMLKAAGFKSIEIEYVPGEYKDLVMGISHNDIPLEEEKRLPLSAHLVLHISNGDPNSEVGDSLDINGKPVQRLDSEDENWF